MNEYEQQAQDFLNETGSTLSLTFEGNKAGYFGKDDPYRDVWTFRLQRGKRSYIAKFGQSINGSGYNGRNTPTPYDILACLGSYYPNDFEDFCNELGYDWEKIQEAKLYHYPDDVEYSRYVIKVFKACQRESEGMDRLFSEEEREKLAEIS